MAYRQELLNYIDAEQKAGVLLPEQQELQDEIDELESELKELLEEAEKLLTVTNFRL